MKKGLFLFLCLSVFFACTKDDAEPTQHISIAKTDLLGTWELLNPIRQSIYIENGEFTSEEELYLPHTFTADGRFSIDDTSFYTRAPEGDFVVDSLMGEIRFYSDPLYHEREGIEIEFLESYNFKTWMVQSLEDGQLHVKERNWGITFEGEIIENEDVWDRVFVKVD